MRRIRKALAKIGAHISYICRDKELDGLDGRNIRLQHGMLTYTGKIEPLRGDVLLEHERLNKVDIFTSPDCDDGCLIIRVPFAFLEVNRIDIRAGDELRVSRLGSRSIAIEAR